MPSPRQTQATEPSILRRTVRAARKWLSDRRVYAQWRQKGYPVPPPAEVKRMVLKTIGRTSRLRVFVETGTLYGDTIAELESSFDALHSIELSPDLHGRATDRFRNAPGVKLWLGDSGDMLGRVLDTVDEPALFWLDGHYSGEGTAKGLAETPIWRELIQISRHSFFRDHVVVIDDARLFEGTSGYPMLADLLCEAKELGFCTFTTGHDMIVLHNGRLPNHRAVGHKR